MVNLKVELFKYLDFLDNVSDNCCENNGKKYIDFDKINCNLATVDCLIIEEIKQYIVLIEFKDLRFLNAQEWVNDREKIQQILLKGYESFFILKQMFFENEIDFNSVSKRFILVYNSNSSKKKIKAHFKNKLNRLKIAYDEVIILECKNFMNLLQRIENVF